MPCMCERRPASAQCSALAWLNSPLALRCRLVQGEEQQGEGTDSEATESLEEEEEEEEGEPPPGHSPEPSLVSRRAGAWRSGSALRGRRRWRWHGGTAASLPAAAPAHATQPP